MLSWIAQLAPLAQMPEPPPVPLPHPEIAPPVELPGGLPLWVVVSAALFILGLVVLVLWLLFKPRPAAPPAPRQPIKTALKALRELRVGAGDIPPPEIGHRVSEILRCYFMARYSVPALFLTTPELFANTTESRREWRERFGPLADIYDQIAFAPQPFTHAQAQGLIENAINKMEEERS